MGHEPQGAGKKLLTFRSRVRFPGGPQCGWSQSDLMNATRSFQDSHRWDDHAVNVRIAGSTPALGAKEKKVIIERWTFSWRVSWASDCSIRSFR